MNAANILESLKNRSEEPIDIIYRNIINSKDNTPYSISLEGLDTQITEQNDINFILETMLEIFTIKEEFEKCQEIYDIIKKMNNK
jgi:hypothetical protein